MIESERLSKCLEKANEVFRRQMSMTAEYLV